MNRIRSSSILLISRQLSHIQNRGLSSRPPIKDYRGREYKVFVSNLSYDVRWPELKDLFKSAGDVTNAHVIANRETGRSTGKYDRRYQTHSCEEENKMNISLKMVS